MRVSPFGTCDRAVASLTFTEKCFFWGFATLLLGSTLALIGKANAGVLVEVPARGGELTEGVIGTPRFINPLLALSEADRDLSTLVYSGLLRPAADGMFAPDLAETYEISDDGLTYTFTIREHAAFHDGQRVTADDVVFTVRLAQNDELRSPKRANWSGVRAESLSDRTVRFTLPAPYSPFLQNATLGILPRHVWESVPAEQVPFSIYNTNAIGSGPFRLARIATDRTGIPEYAELTAFEDFALGKPYIETIRLVFYAGETELVEAFERGDIEQMNSVAPASLEALTRPIRTERFPLPRVFAVFFNQNENPIFTHTSVREALSIAIDREGLVKEILDGHGTEVDGPLPPNAATEDLMIPQGDTEEALLLLSNAGWTRDDAGALINKDGEEMRVTLTTSNATELARAAEFVKQAWEDLGVAVDLELYETGVLNQDIIRPRAYEALLFGHVIGRDPDPFAFWHSSQRNDPGLNVALYANLTVDELVEDIRTTTERADRQDLYAAFEKEIREDAPAAFLYTPDFVYLVHERLKGLSLGPITTASERFANIHEWHLETERVWPIFAKTSSTY